MHTPRFALLLLVICWLPVLLVPFALYVEPLSEIAGYRAGWFLLLPLGAVTLLQWLGAMRAFLQHKTEIILPNYRFLDALSSVQKHGMFAALVLSCAGAIAFWCLLPEHLLQTTAISNFGLPGECVLLPPLALIPPYQWELAPLAMIGGVYAGTAWWVWKRFRALHFLAGCGLLWVASRADHTLQNLALWEQWQGLFFGLGMGLALWMGVSWSWNKLAKQPQPRARVGAMLGLMVSFSLGWGLLVSSPITLQRTATWLLWVGISLALGVFGRRSLHSMRTLLQEPALVSLRGHTAYVIGATWPWAWLVALFGWGVLGGSAYGYPLHKGPVSMFWLLAANLLAYWSFALLRSIHHTKLHPPNRIWLFFRPLLMILLLLLPFGPAAMALLKNL